MTFNAKSGRNTSTVTPTVLILLKTSYLSMILSIEGSIILEEKNTARRMKLCGMTLIGICGKRRV